RVIAGAPYEFISSGRNDVKVPVVPDVPLCEWDVGLSLKATPQHSFHFHFPVRMILNSFALAKFAVSIGRKIRSIHWNYSRIAPNRCPEGCVCQGYSDKAHDRENKVSHYVENDFERGGIVLVGRVASTTESFAIRACSRYGENG